MAWARSALIVGCLRLQAVSQEAATLLPCCNESYKSQATFSGITDQRSDAVPTSVLVIQSTCLACVKILGLSLSTTACDPKQKMEKLFLFVCFRDTLGSA